MKPLLAVSVALAAAVSLYFVGEAVAHTNRVDIPNQADTTCGTNSPDEPGCVFWYGHGHRDVVDGTNTDDYFFGRGGPDNLVGHGKPDWFVGGRGDDLLVGERSHDHLFGGKGDDVLRCGESDSDQATGGDGADRFVDCERVFDVEPRDTMIRSCDWNDEECVPGPHGALAGRPR
jgi:Ca2+-binding RTX toxin-like protein